MSRFGWLPCHVLRLNALKSARRRRESYIGPWLPEPVFDPEDGDAADKSAADGAEDLPLDFRWNGLAGEALDQP